MDLTELRREIDAQLERMESDGRFDVARFLRAARAGVAGSPPDSVQHGRFQLFLGLGLQAEYGRALDEGVLSEARQALGSAVALLPETDSDRPFALSTLANVLQATAASSDDPELLAEAAAVARAALDSLADDDASRPACLVPLGFCLRALGEQTRDVLTLREAVAVTREAVGFVGDDKPYRHGYVYSLGLCLLALFRETRDADTLAEAIAAISDAIASAPSGTPERAQYQIGLGEALEEQHRLSQDPGALAESIRADRAAAITSDHRKYDLYLADLARKLSLLADRTGRLDTLTEAADAWRAAVTATPASDPAHARRQSRLRRALQALHERTGDPGLAREAVTAGQAAAAAAAPGDLDYQSDLAESWHSVFQATGDLTALSQAEALMRAVIATPGLRAEDRARHLNSLSVALHRRYEQTGNPGSLAESITAQRDVIALVPDDPTYLSNLGAALGDEFERSGDPGTLTEALTVCRAAVAATPPDDPDRAVWLGNLGAAALNLFNLTAAPEALAEAVAANRAAADASDGDAARHAGDLSNLAGALYATFVQAGDQRLLAEAVDAARAAVAAFPADAPNRVRILSNHAAILADAYLSVGDRDLLTEAVDTGRAAVEACPADHAERANYQSNLAAILLIAYSRTGNLDSLAQAAAAGRASVAGTHPDQPTYPRYLSNLAATLATLYAMTGEAPLATEALDAARRALSATPGNSPDRARCQTNLQSVLLALYVRTTELEALTQAVEAGRAAAAIDPGHSLYARCQSNLAQALSLLHLRTGTAELLTEAEQAARTAVAAMGEGAPLYAAALSTLGTILHARYVEDEKQPTLTEAIAVLRQAEACSVGADPARSRYRLSLCLSLYELFDETADLDLLTESVAIGRSAVAATAEGGPDYARTAATLGRALRRLHAATGDPGALTEARAVLAKAAHSVSPVRDRIDAGLEQARIQTLAGDAVAAAGTVEAIMRLMPLVAPSALRRHDREHRLGETAGIAQYAAATALGVGDPGRAVELLEQARGQLLGEAMDARVNLRRLRQEDADLADEFDKRRHQPSSADLPLLIAPDSGVLPLGLAAGTPEAGSPADDVLLERIRSRPGLAGFLATPSIAQLCRHAQDGPIVMVSSAWNRGDALIVTASQPDPVLHVPLPGLTRDMAERQVQRLLDARRVAVSDPDLSARVQSQADLHEVLAWLWDAVAEPVLAALGHTAAPAPGQPWPRLWWSPVGPLSYLPIHAAGHHLDRSGDRTALDRVISSYTATIRALAYSRQAYAAAAGSPDGAAADCLIVATPEDGSLPGVTEEAAIVAGLLPAALVLRGAAATHDAVTGALRTRRIAHFACHGISDWDNPGRSRLLLHDHETSPLTVGAISALPLPGGDLAYLSACSTTDTSPSLADEAVHITSAFQLAGYRNVIGTLWPVSDKAATQVAADVYRYLTGNGTQPPDTSASARALHHATRRLRAGYPRVPSAWAGHVHTGM